MKTRTLPVFCGVALTAMSAAGLSHWWSVHQFVAAIDSGLPVPSQPAATPQPAEPGPSPAPQRADRIAAQPSSQAPEARTAATTEPAGTEIYMALLSRMENLQNQNRDLLDQLAETNRDLMKLEFRVDTHSESFRPLPVSEDHAFTTLSTGTIGGPGVLPPRAEPVNLPTYE
ncbi:MAG: hypothetical protein ACQCXQ_09760 [Verrucomicrobiales bacterium]|nr:hypothetical protein [Verrucomicrobiota bacterium JB025]